MATIKKYHLRPGGVLFDIDTGRTNEGLLNWGDWFSKPVTLQKADPLFDELEKGRIEEAAFYEAIRQENRIAAAGSGNAGCMECPHT